MSVNFNPTILVDGIATSSTELIDRYDGRLSRYSVLQEATEEQTVVDKGEIQSLKNTTGRPVKIPVRSARTIAATTDRNCAIVGTEAESAFVTPVWTKRVYSFQMVVDKYEDNYIRYAHDWARNLQDVRRSAYADFENYVIATLEANKTAVNLYTEYGALVGGAIQIPNADKLVLYDKIDTMMNLNDYYAPYVDFSNTGSKDNQRYIARQGTQNAVNLEPQVLSFEFKRSNRINNGVGVAETHYTIPKGSIAFITHLFLKARKKDVIIPGTDYWDSWQDPLFPAIQWAMHYQRVCSDTALTGTRNAGEPATVELFELSVDFSTILHYFSTPGETNVFKTELMQ